MEQARLAGFPSVVVGSTPLDDSQDAKPAEDAEEQIALLAGHASAYVATAGVDDPADRFFGGVLSRNVVQVPGAAAPLPLLQSSTLGYAPSQRFTNDPEDELATRQTDAALLMIDVGVGRLDPTTGVAPVDVVSEPLLQGLAIDEGSRAIPLGWAIPLFISASDPSPRRFLMSPGPNEPLRPASPRVGSGPMVDQCRFFLDMCGTVVPSALAFSSGNPQIARFVAVRAGGRETEGLPQVVLDASGHVIDDPRGFFCPLALGTVDVTVTALGRRVTTPVRVIPVPRIDGLRATAIPPGTCAFPNLDVSDEEPKPAATPQRPPAPRHRRRPIPLRPRRTRSRSPSRRSRSRRPRLRGRSRRRRFPGRRRRSCRPRPRCPSRRRRPMPPARRWLPHPSPRCRPPRRRRRRASRSRRSRRRRCSRCRRCSTPSSAARSTRFETDSAAVAYAHPPSPLPWEIAGGVAVLALVMAGGGLAGRSRSRAAAVARASAGS